MRSKILNREEFEAICGHVVSIIEKKHKIILPIKHNMRDRTGLCQINFGNNTSDLFIKGRRLPSADTGDDWDFRNLIYKKNCYYIFVLSERIRINVNDIGICAMSPIDIDNLLSPDKEGTNFKIEISYNSNQSFAVRRKGGSRTICIDFDAIYRI